MNISSEWKRKWIPKLTAAVLAGSAGCQSSPQPPTYGNLKYDGPRISAMEIILKTSDAAAARYAKSDKSPNGTPPDNAVGH
jgi:hypothetical protein